MDFDWSSLLAGRNPFGSAGFNPFEALNNARQSYGQDIDPRLYDYGFSVYDPVAQGIDGNRTYSLGANPRFATDDEGIRLEGDNRLWLPAHGALRGYHNNDPSLFRYDEEFGGLTPRENIVVDEGNFFDKWGGLLMAGAGILGPALAHQGLLGGLTGGGESGTGAFDVGGSGGFGGSTPISSLPDSYWSASANAGNVASDASAAAGYPENMAEWVTGSQSGSEGLLGTGGAASYSPANSLMDRFSWFANNPIGSVTSAITNNPMGAARAALGIGSLVGGGQRPAGGPPAGSPGVNLSAGDAPKFAPWQGQFQMNPYLMQPVPFMQQQMPFMGLFGG